MKPIKQITFQERYGEPDETAPDARQSEINDLPDEVLPFLHGSRYCDTQRLTKLAWSLFGPVGSGWQRVQAICDYVHGRIQFGYHHARCDRTAAEGHEERVGVCRDFAHLAVTLCRCMNIPARYCTGYLGILVCPKTPRRWTLVPGLRFFSTDDGSPSMPGITSPVSGASSSPADGMRRMLPSPPSSVMRRLFGLKLSPRKSNQAESAGQPEANSRTPAAGDPSLSVSSGLVFLDF